MKTAKHRLTRELPPGWRQRLALGCALLHEPGILFLDEPTSGVDPITRSHFWAFIRHLTATGVTVFVTTHYMDEAQHCDRVVMINEGKIVVSGPPSRIVRGHVPAETGCRLERCLYSTDDPEPLMNLIKIQAISRKEYYHLIRDFRSLYLAFIIPLLLIFLFGYALSLDVDNIRVVVVDHDQTDLSRDLIRRLDASSYFMSSPIVADDRIVTQYLDDARRRRVIIPSKWTQTSGRTGRAPLQILIDGSDPNFASITRGYITAFIDRYNQKPLIEFLNRQGIEKISPPVEGRIRVWFNEDLESRNFIVPGIIAIIIMIVGAMMTSLVIAREYENGTMETIRSLPVTGMDS